MKWDIHLSVEQRDEVSDVTSTQTLLFEAVAPGDVVFLEQTGTELDVLEVSGDGVLMKDRDEGEQILLTEEPLVANVDGAVLTLVANPRPTASHAYGLYLALGAVVVALAASVAQEHWKRTRAR